MASGETDSASDGFLSGCSFDWLGEDFVLAEATGVPDDVVADFFGTGRDELLQGGGLASLMEEADVILGSVLFRLAGLSSLTGGGHLGTDPRT